MLTGEKIILEPTYLADYVLPVLIMPCPYCGYSTFQTEAFVPKPGIENVSRETPDNVTMLLQEPEPISLLPGGFTTPEEQAYWDERGIHHIVGTSAVHDAGYFSEFKKEESDGST